MRRKDIDVKRIKRSDRTLIHDLFAWWLCWSLALHIALAIAAARRARCNQTLNFFRQASARPLLSFPSPCHRPHPLRGQLFFQISSRTIAHSSTYLNTRLLIVTTPRARFSAFYTFIQYSSRSPRLSSVHSARPAAIRSKTGLVIYLPSHPPRPRLLHTSRLTTTSLDYS